MFYIYNGSEIDKVVNFLSNNGYNLSNFDNFWTFIVNPDDFKVLIDTTTKAFFIFVSSNQVLPIVKEHDVRNISKYVDLMVALGFETSEREFMESLIPGYYIVLDKMGETYYGVMITTRIAMIFDSKGNNMSYLTNFTENESYHILKVCKPNDKYFRAKDTEFMDVVWSRPKNRIKKSISEIEALLQLEPGTLEIYG